MGIVIDLKGSVSLITGAGGGIGAACAKRFAEAGCDLILLDIDESKLHNIEEQLKPYGINLLTHVCDISDENEIIKMVEYSTNEFGKVDILINNAAVNYRETAFKVDLNNWDKIMEVNLKSTFILSREIAKVMIKNQQGSIVNISSELSLIGVKEGQLAYSVSKAGLNQLTRVLAAEWAEHGIRVNTVMPGLTETPFVTELLSSSDYKDSFIKNIPLSRLAKPQDVANAVFFMASDLAGFITGQSIIVDGGYSAIR